MADYIGELRELVGSRPIIACGANVIILDKDNRVLLHHRVERDIWGLPGGMMELGETLEETATREVYEEVGLKCNNLKLFNIYSGKQLYYKYPSGDEVYNVTATYICKDYTGVIVLDRSEGRDARFISINEFPENMSPTIKPITDEFIKSFNNIITNI